MPSFRYQKGDTPLDGFTIEQAVGRGGFGEVYYAVSDAGRQVALKAVQNFEDVELRGISHVMNLKSQHLVSIFDIKHNADNDPFVIMEFISGPSLRDVLDESPAGMGDAKAAYFLREMAKGITYLHDCDVVHRDLKPHNVFFEDGIVKIGDYSLSKLMTMSHRTGHTMTVGSVHYMAPEISLGRYDKTVDIYALGVMLYEMLTGKPPFLGESMGEVLMRHMSGEVDVSDLSEPFAGIVLKAMAKNPDDRYQTADEMAGAIFGHEHIQNSVAGFAPTELSFVAGNAAKKMASAQERPAAKVPSRKQPVRPGAPRQRRGGVQGVAERDESLNWLSTPGAAESPAVAYSFGRLVSQVLSSAAILPTKHSYSDKPDGLLSGGVRLALAGLIFIAFSVFAGVIAGWDMGFLVLAAMIGGIVIAHPIRKRIPGSSFFLSRLATFGASLPLVAPMICEMNFSAVDETELILPILIPAILFDWKHLTSVARPKRIMMLPIVVAVVAFFFVAVNITHHDELSLGGCAVIAGAMIAAQMLFKYDEKQAARCKAEYDWSGTLLTALNDGQPVAQDSPGFANRAIDGRGGDRAVVTPDSDPFAPTLLKNPLPVDRQPVAVRETPGPGQSLDSTQQPQRHPGPPGQAGFGNVSDITRPQALVLAVIGLVVPVAGLHRFATGRRVSGIVWLFTFGFLTIGTFVDIALIVCGVFKDAYGRHVTNWDWQFSGPVPARAVHAMTSPPTPVNAYSSVPPRFSAGGLLISFIGLIFVAIGFVFSGLVSIDSVELIQSIPDLRTDIQDVWGSDSWPSAFNSMFMIVAVGGMLFGGSLMAIGRFRLGGAHTVRLPLGLGALSIGWLIAHEYFSGIPWPTVEDYVDQERVGPIIETFVNGRNIDALAPAAMFFIAGVALIAWPPNRQPVPLGTDSQQAELKNDPQLVEHKA